MSKLNDALKELFPTQDPKAASRDGTGAVETQRPAPKERKEGDYLPVIAILVGVGLLALAYLKPAPVNVPVYPPPRSEGSSENEW